MRHCCFASGPPVWPPRPLNWTLPTAPLLAELSCAEQAVWGWYAYVHAHDIQDQAAAVVWGRWTLQVLATAECWCRVAVVRSALATDADAHWAAQHAAAQAHTRCAHRPWATAAMLVTSIAAAQYADAQGYRAVAHAVLYAVVHHSDLLCAVAAEHQWDAIDLVWTLLDTCWRVQLPDAVAPLATHIRQRVPQVAHRDLHRFAAALDTPLATEPFWQVPNEHDCWTQLRTLLHSAADWDQCWTLFAQRRGTLPPAIHALFAAQVAQAGAVPWLCWRMIQHEPWTAHLDHTPPQAVSLGQLLVIWNTFGAATPPQRQSLLPWIRVTLEATQAALPHQSALRHYLLPWMHAGLGGGADMREDLDRLAALVLDPRTPPAWLWYVQQIAISVGVQPYLDPMWHTRAAQTLPHYLWWQRHATPAPLRVDPSVWTTLAHCVSAARSLAVCSPWQRGMVIEYLWNRIPTTIPPTHQRSYVALAAALMPWLAATRQDILVARLAPVQPSCQSVWGLLQAAPRSTQATPARFFVQQHLDALPPAAQRVACQVLLWPARASILVEASGPDVPPVIVSPG